MVLEICCACQWNGDIFAAKGISVHADHLGPGSTELNISRFIGTAEADWTGDDAGQKPRRKR